MSQSSPSQYAVTRQVFLWALALCYLIAFVSFAVQAKGLIGSDGILPMQQVLDYWQDKLGASRYVSIPSLFWLWDSNTALMCVCWGGAGLSLLLFAGICPVLVCVLLWLFYLSLVNGAGLFMGYQWDILLLEVGFLGIFMAPLRWWQSPGTVSEPPRLILWLLRWLLFRLMFASGLVKLLSGDPHWWQLTALDLHYETQPLPTWIGWYAHQLPGWFQQVSTAGMFFIELILPFFFFGPGRLRRIAAVVTIGFQILIMLTGNYGFFNLLAIALCVLLFDDGHGFKRLARAMRRVPSRIQWPRPVQVLLLAVLVPLSLVPMTGRLFAEKPWMQPVWQVYRTVRPFHLTSGYGLFAVMTTRRDEITIEGSDDGVTWHAYEFRWKPNAADERPRFVEPHQPRLDWQMWFAALRSYQGAPWLQNFMIRLLEGSDDVLALLKSNPFPEKPPQQVRARVARYQFSDLETKRQTGDWWMVWPERAFSPVISR